MPLCSGAGRDPDDPRPLHLPPLLGFIDEARSSTFDPIQERQDSLRQPVTPGAKAAEPVLDLIQLREVIRRNPQATVVFSDVHGYVELLQGVMTTLGIRRSDPIRPARVGSIGDLIDGRNERDGMTIDFAKEELDFVLAGNHEVAFLGGPRFGGQPASDKNNLTRSLGELVELKLLVAAEASSGVLLTHAGVNQAYAKRDALTTATYLNAKWEKFLTTPRARSRMLREPAALLAPSPLRSGGSLDDLSSSPAPGCFWQAWRELLVSYPQQFCQIVGHSPRGRIETSLDNTLINIDAAGYRLGIAVIAQNGEVTLGSDFQGAS